MECPAVPEEGSRGGSGTEAAHQASPFGCDEPRRAELAAKLERLDMGGEEAALERNKIERREGAVARLSVKDELGMKEAELAMRRPPRGNAAGGMARSRRDS